MDFTDDQIATLRELLSDALSKEFHEDYAKEFVPLFEMVCAEAERRKLWWAR